MYNKRTWLNSNKSHSTGSVVAFSGQTEWRDGKKGIEEFLAISDCHVTARLHNIYGENHVDFLEKVKLLRSELDEFINYLENDKERLSDI